MQTVSTQFDQRTVGRVRPINWSLLISFEKAYDANIDFFTIGVSSIGGTDILKGEGSVVQEWDKYNYTDFSDRILGIEINRETEVPTNPITLATATITLDNHDDIFTIGNVNSDLDGFLLPRRPVRLSLGFGGELIPKFVGVTDGRPEIDEKAKTAKFVCIDFLKAIMDIPLEEETIYVDQRTDEIISGLLETGGLDPSQFDLDTGTVIIPFAYFPKGTKLGDGLRWAAQAELGNLSLGENGQPVFQNRTNWNSHTPSFEFNKDNLIERKTNNNDTVINVVEVYSNARVVQPKQKLWEIDQPVELKPGLNEIFANFSDDYGDLPVTDVDDPEYFTGADTSLYATNQFEDGTGLTLDSFIALDSTSQFSTAFKMVFENTHTQSIYLTQLELFATPAKVAKQIYIRAQDDASVGTKDGYEEHPHKIENDLIQDDTAANTIAQIILADRSQQDNQEDWIAKAVPQLQIGDMVDYVDENTNETYFVTRINDIVDTNGYRQKISVTQRTINVYWRIGISIIGGTDAIGP